MKAARTPVIKKIPAGVRALPVPIKSVAPVKFVAESCGCGRPIGRASHLDELDKDRS